MAVVARPPRSADLQDLFEELGMNNLRLTIIMFIFGAALALSLLAGFGGGGTPATPTTTTASAPPIEPELFAPAGLKQAPWLGEQHSVKARPAPAAPPAGTRPAAPAPNMVVIELFTSEGCSSCPPADRLLADLIREHAGDAAFFPLAFHVDYWNNLGWTDAFSSAVNSERQRSYARKLGDDRVYTPQMIINGATGFVGSNRDKAVAAIAEARKQPPSARITATRGEINPGEPLAVECSVAAPDGKSMPAQVRVLALLVEDGLSSRVTAGENKGLELKHDRVVRAMAESDRGPDSRLTLRLTPPKDIRPERCAVVVIAQNSADMRIIGAATATAPGGAD